MPNSRVAFSGEPQPIDCAAVKWMTKTELAHFAFPAADAQLLQKLNRKPNLLFSINLDTRLKLHKHS